VIVERPSKSVIEFMVKAKANFKSKSTANNVDIYIPVPDDSEKPQFKSSVGTI
jgi:AP-1 complex subunit mu